MAGKHEGIDRQIPQGYRYVAYGLCSVHEEEDAVIVEEFADCPDILHRTKYVACVGHDHESGVGPDGSFHRLGSDVCVCERDNIKPDAAGTGVLVEGTKHGVVVKGSGEDVGSVRMTGKKSRNQYVQRVGCVVGEDEVSELRDAEE